MTPEEMAARIVRRHAPGRMSHKRRDALQEDIAKAIREYASDLVHVKALTPAS